MSDDTHGIKSTSEKVITSAVLSGLLCTVIWAAAHHSGEIWVWIFASGLAIGAAVPWFPRNGKMRWELHGDSLALTLVGFILSIICR
ncbi:MAG: hypothetical protein ABR928_15025 [Terracidiphilus sp.]|jgi:hypothetical protein